MHSSIRVTVLGLVLGLVIALSGCGTPAEIVETDNPEPKAFEAFSESVHPVQFRKIVVHLDRGEHIGAIEVGLACVPHGDLAWRGGRLSLSPEEFDEIFRDEASKINLERLIPLAPV